MTMKSITGEDPLKYVNHRLEYLRINTQMIVLSQPTSRRETVRRMLVGRRRELALLADLIHHNQVEAQSKQYAIKIWEHKNKKEGSE